MNKPTKQERRWATTIISAIAAIVSLYVAVLVFQPNAVGILSTTAIGLFGILAAITAFEGRPRTLRWLFDSFLHLP